MIEKRFFLFALIAVEGLEDHFIRWLSVGGERGEFRRKELGRRIRYEQVSLAEVLEVFL
jgi:hypothetical protein